LIEKDMDEWISNEIKNKNHNESRVLEVKMETVIGLSYSKDKEGIPFEHMALQIGGDFYYHLVFEFEEGINDPIGVRFQRDLVENIRRKCQQALIGETRYTTDDIMKIGRYLITKFGTYYKIFWNCQHFARILATVLTNGTLNTDFFLTTDRFIAGFLFRLPITGSITATSILKPSEKKLEKLLKKISKEYKDILIFEIDQVNKKKHDKLSKSWIMS
jgi:hypothetical protein